MRGDRADAPLKCAPLVCAAADPRSFPWKTRLIHSERCRELGGKPSISLMTRSVSVSAYDRCVFTQSRPPGLRVIAPPMSPLLRFPRSCHGSGRKGVTSTSHLRPIQAPSRAFIQNHAAFQLLRWKNTEVGIYRQNNTDLVFQGGDVLQTHYRSSNKIELKLVSKKKKNLCIIISDSAI